jgi:uncharacterized membrane protein
MRLGALRLVAGALALVAAGISAYLVTVHYSGGPIACFAGGGCETVQKSAYSAIGAVPLSVLGLAVYLALVVALAWRGELAAIASFALGLSAGIFAVYLIVVQTIVLDAICVWCMTTDAIALVLVALMTLRLRLEPPAGSLPAAEAAAGAPAPQL